MRTINESILILFKSVVIEKESVKMDKGRIKAINASTIPYGYMIDFNIIIQNNDLVDICNAIEKKLIVKGSQINNAFHKSWDKVANATDFQLYMEQIIHYMTTYGLESLGVEYDKDNVFIPYEKLEIPELKEDIKLLYIRGITKEELKEKVMAMLSSGVALKQETIDLISDTFGLFEFTEEEISGLKNKEIKMMLYQEHNIVPKDPIAFLRYVIYEATGKTLIIKNKQTIEEIEQKDLNNKSNDRRISSLFEKYTDVYGLESLATIFYRYKPLWLAFRRKCNSLKPMINKIRKLAPQYHRPMPEDYLNSITKYIKQGKGINEEELEEKLSGASIFRKIRLMYALHYRSLYNGSIVYKIRNGSAYSTSLDNMETFGPAHACKETSEIVKKSIVENLSKSVKGKKILLPDFIDYALPSTEKSFTGNFPSGTKVSVPKDMIVGIHWENQNKGPQSRVDLDLSLTDMNGNKFGWDGDFRDEDNTILFSGDLTDAPLPNGASELFYVKNSEKNVYIMSVNYYNYDDKIPVPFKIIVGQDDSGLFKQNYVLDPNNILAMTSSTMVRKQKIIGILFVDKEGCKFVFSEMDMGKGITLNPGSDYIKHTTKYLSDFYSNSISMKDLLELAGAELWVSADFGPNDIEADKKKSKIGEYIDLSPEALEKDTILSLISGD